MNAARRRPPFVALLVLALLVGGVAAVAINPALLACDATQERLDVAGAPLGPGHTLGQTVIAGHARLRRIELLAVVYESLAAAPGAHVCLDLERLDAASAAPVTACRPVAGVAHNETLTFDFPPQTDSRGAVYRLTLRGDRDLNLSVWLTDYDAYAAGEAWEDGAPRRGDLYFRTYYDYALSEALRDLISALGRRAWPMGATLIVLLAPGAALRTLLPGSRRREPVVAVAIAAALSIAFWPLLLLWATTLGVRIRPLGAWAVVMVLLGVATVRLLLRHPEPGPKVVDGARAPRRRSPWPFVALALIMLLVGATRVLQVRDLVLPAWVDSVHHTMITRLIVDGGRVPASYRPYMPADGFHYHFGFHAGAAALAWLSGLPAERAVLLFGQALNVLAPLAAYTLAWWIGRNRWGGVVAALVVGSLCYMPAYYVTWGRYTQLAGLVLLPPLFVLTTQMLERPRALGAGLRDGALVGAALLLAGLILTHYRVLVFYALWAIPQGALVLWRAGRGASRQPATAADGRLRWRWGPGVRRGALCAGAALLLALPWVVGFVARVTPEFATTYVRWEAGDGANAFPSALLTVGWTPPLLYLAGAGALWGGIRRRGEAMVTAIWVGLCLLVANPRLLGGKDTWFLTNSSVIIAFWLPVGALCGWLVGDVARLLALVRLPRLGRVGSRGVSALLLAVVVPLAAVGSWRMVDIVNPVTVLATADDLAAFAWAQEHTPPDALFLVNTGVWQAPVRYGTDAGWWLNLIADRRTTLPSTLYMLGGTAYYDEVNALGTAVEEAASVDDTALLERLRAAGVTHVFVGARGGRLLPRDLDPSPHYRTLYSRGPVRIYEVLYP
jgi:hypothetical protein